MKTKLLFRLTTALSFLLATLPVQVVKAAQAKSAVGADLVQFTSGGYILGFAVYGMYAATGMHALHVDFVDANRIQPQSDTPANQQGKAAALNRVTYADLWNGITLTYTAGAGSIYTTTYTVVPGADPANIRLRYNAPLTLNDDGTLNIAFETGAMTESAPIAWQVIDGLRVPVDVSFRVSGQEVGFDLGSYDPRFTLTIDPNLVWNTFLGGSEYDSGLGIIVDGSGNIYVAGGSYATWGSPVIAYTGGHDAFAAKLNSSGSLTWNTFLGGSGDDYGTGIAVDGSGNVYVTGYSNTTWGSPVRVYSGSYDAFAAKLDSSGGMIWNTFLGGNGDDIGNSITVDGSGNIYVSGYSATTWGSPVRAYTYGADAFGAKLDTSGGLTWSTFLGGSGIDYGTGIAVDGSGNVYMSGYSTATWGSPVRAYSGNYDTFAAKLDSSGGLTWNTFLGGSGIDYGKGIAVDGSGNVYVTGYSSSTWGSPRSAYTGGDDASAAKLNSSGALIWNTFLGGSGNDAGTGITVDGSGNVYVAGCSPSSWGSPVRAYTNGSDAFAAKLNSYGALSWNTFLGGSGDDYGRGIAVDGSGSVYVTGYSASTWGNPRRTFSGSTDAFTVKVDLAPPTVVSSLRASTNPTNAASVDFIVTFSEAVTGVGANDFTLYTPGISLAFISAISGYGNVRTVTVTIVTGDGTLRLNVIDDDSILDLGDNPLGGPGAGNGNYYDGETYTIDKTSPIVTASGCANSNPTGAASVDFTVFFSEAVSGVDASDFTLSTTGISDASITAVDGSGNMRTVTVNTGTGSGTLRLDVIDNDSIVDWIGNPLGGPGAGNGNFTIGGSCTVVKPAPGVFTKLTPTDASYATTSPTLAWSASTDATSYEYCYDTSNNNTCDTSWISTGSSTSVSLSGLTNNRTYYWQVRATNNDGTTEADGGTWGSFTARNQTFADVPIDNTLWAYIEAFYNAGITIGCGVSPLIYCPEQPVTRASMAVFLLRAKYGSSYTPPAATHTFADLPVAGKEWQEAWVDQFSLEGITTGCGTGPLIYCPETAVTRAAMAVFILRAKYGSSYTPPAASHFFSDLPVAGKEWMEPWVDELYREGITTGCGTGPLIYCPETAVKRQAMAAFIVRAFGLALP